MRHYFKMKAKEIELKLLVYTYLLAVLKNKESLIALCGKLAAELSNTPTEELKDKFIAAMTEMAQAKSQTSVS